MAVACGLLSHRCFSRLCASSSSHHLSRYFSTILQDTSIDEFNQELESIFGGPLGSGSERASLATQDFTSQKDNLSNSHTDKTNLSHVDARGRASMVKVSDEVASKRCNQELESIFGAPLRSGSERASLATQDFISHKDSLGNSQTDNRNLSHVDARGRASMVNVSDEVASKRCNQELESIFGAPFRSGSERASLATQDFTSNKDNRNLSHVDARGRASMVNVSDKLASKRVSVASGKVYLGPVAFSLVVSNQIAKGDVLTVAKIAGICGAKQTATLIPLCHNLVLSDVQVELRLDEEKHAVDIRAEASTVSSTGVEMEALTAVSVAGLTVYDMCKAVSKEIKICDVQLESKTGGKSGDWSRSKA